VVDVHECTDCLFTTTCDDDPIALDLVELETTVLSQHDTALE